jgi:hypothetical protein
MGWPAAFPPPPLAAAPPHASPSSGPRLLPVTWGPSPWAAPGSRADSSCAAAASGPVRSATFPRVMRGSSHEKEVCLWVAAVRSFDLVTQLTASEFVLFTDCY